MSQIVVGSKACPPNEVVIAIEQCDASKRIAERIVDLQIQLGFSVDDVQDMINSQINIKSSQYILLQTLEFWIAKNGNAATLKSLILCFERLREEKIVEQLEEFKKYCFAKNSTAKILDNNKVEDSSCTEVMLEFRETDKLLNLEKSDAKSVQTCWKEFLDTNTTVEIRKFDLFILIAVLALLFLFFVPNFIRNIHQLLPIE